MAVSIPKFLKSKGGVGLIVSLNEGDKLWSELKSEIGVANDTLSARKREATEIGLVTAKKGDYEGGVTDFYMLTEMGEDLADHMVRSGLASNWQSMRTHEQKVEELTEEIVAWVDDNPGEFAFYREAQEETYIRRSDDEGQDSPEQESSVSVSDGTETDVDAVDGNVDTDDDTVEPDEVWGDESETEEDSGQLDLDDIFGSGDGTDEDEDSASSGSQ